MTDTSTIQRWIHETVKPLGYRRKGKCYWIKFTDECVLFFHLQTDTPYHYLNLCVYIRSLKPDLTFETFKVGAHISMRADDDLGNLLDLSCPMDPTSRELSFKVKLTSLIIPTLESMGTIEGIKTNDIDNHNKFFLWGFPVRRLLGVPLEPRFTYHAFVLDDGSGTRKVLSYELSERDRETDKVSFAGAVDTLEEAEEWTKQIFLDITREEAGDLLLRFLKGKSEYNEFHHFLNEPLKHDKLLQKVKQEISEIPKAFPPKKGSGAFCNDEGMQRIRDLAKNLREQSAKTH